MSFLPALRGLVTKSAQPQTIETKVVYTGSDGIVDASRNGFFGSSTPQGPTWSLSRALVEGFMREPYVFKAVDTIAETSSSLLFGMRDSDGDEIEGHPLTDLLNAGKANPLESGHNLRYRLSVQTLLSPMGAFVQVQKSRGGDILNCALLPPDRTRPIPNEDDPSKLIKGFEVTSKDGAKKTILSTEQVRWVRKNHPLDPYAAITPLEAAGLSIQLSYFARLFNVSFMRNDGRPGGILAVQAPSGTGEVEPMSDADMDRLEARFGKGPVEAGKLSVISGAATYTNTAAIPRDAEYQSTSGNSKVEILSAFGVPESQIGHASGATYANADKEGYAFWTKTMAAHNRMIVSAFAEDFPDGAEGFLDTSEIEELQEPVRKKREEARKEFETGLRSMVDYGKLAGIQVPDMPETRAFYIKVGTTAVPGVEEDREFFAQQAAAANGAPQQEELSDTTGESGQGGGGASADATGGGAAPSGGGTAPSGDQQQTYAARRVSASNPGVVSTKPASAGKPTSDGPTPLSGTNTVPESKALPGKADADPESASETPTDLLSSTEDALNAAMTKVIDEQANLVETRLRSPRFKKGTRHWSAESKADVRGGGRAIDAEAVVQVSRWAETVGERLEPIVTDAAQTAAEGIIEDLGLDDTEVKARHRRLTPAQAKVVAEAATEALWVAKNAMTKHTEALAQRIVEADEAGRDLDGIVDEVRRYADQYRRGWSRVVMVQVGQTAIEGTRLRTADLSKKQRDIVRTWVSRRDVKVRPTHALKSGADGQRVRLGQPFKVGGSSLRHPGDPLGPANETIGCRCRVRYTSKASGRIISAPTSERKVLTLAWSP